MANETPLPGERWKRHKGGVVEVVVCCHHADTRQPYVVFVDSADEETKCCSLAWWHQPVAGRSVRRFTRVMT